MRHRLVTALVAIAIVAFVFGIVGWIQYSDSRTEHRLDLWTILYRTLVLFAGEDGEPFQVPWTLDVARLTAPLVLSGTVVLTVSAFASRHLQRFGCRHAADHVVLVGDAHALGALLERERPDLRSTRVVLGDPPARLDGVVLHTNADDDEWVTCSNASNAARILIAAGDDARSTRLAITAAERCPRARIVVDLEDHGASRWLALRLAVRYPDVDARVSCLADSVTDRAVTRVLDHPSMTDPAAVCVMVGGDESAAPLALLLVQRLVERVGARSIHGGGRLLLVTPSSSVERVADAHRRDATLSQLLGITTVASLSDAQHQVAAAPVIVLIATDASGRSALWESEASVRFGDASIVATGADTMASGSARDGDDFVARLAALLGRDPVGTRHLLSRLVEAGWRIEPSSTSGTSPMMRRETIERLMAHGGLEREQAASLGDHLIAVGFRLDTP